MSFILVSLAISLFLVIPYYKTKSFKTRSGQALFVLALLATLLRIFVLKNFPTKIYVESTFVYSAFVALFFTTLGIFSLRIFGKPSVKRMKSGYFARLLPAYLFFGTLQQVFSQFVFFESAFFFLGNAPLAILASAMYYTLFHFGHEMKRATVLLMVMGVVFSTAYYLYGNVLWLGISHGLLGALYYTLYVKKDQLKWRLA